MKENLLFYTRNQDAYNEAGHKALRAQYSWAGEGRFAALEDRIAASPGCILDLSKKFTRNTLACDLGLSSNELEAFLKFLADPDECNLLIEIEEMKYTVPRIQTTFAVTMKKRVAARDRKTPKTEDEVSNTPEETPKNDENPGNETCSESSPELPESCGNFSKVAESFHNFSTNKTKQNKTTLDNIKLDNNYNYNDNVVVVVVEDIKKLLESQKNYQLNFDDDTLQSFAEFCIDKQLNSSYVDFVIGIMKKNEAERKKPILHPNRYFEKIFYNQNLAADYSKKPPDNPKKQPRAAPPSKCKCEGEFKTYETTVDGKAKSVCCKKCGIEFRYDVKKNIWIKQEERVIFMPITLDGVLPNLTELADNLK